MSVTPPYFVQTVGVKSWQICQGVKRQQSRVYNRKGFVVQKGDCLFVYGTLRRGERADLQKQAHNFGVSFMGIDVINGKMYHLGAYPGVKNLVVEFDSNLPIVYGEVFRIHEPSIVALMDAYEGYDADEPTRGLYNRSQVFTEKERPVWVYSYNPPVTEDQRIDTGDWCKAPPQLIRNKALRL
jgi:gamma-glutamylcyclotransferase (GGCT)/AIG2-like uncharacterized protein YtfP